METKDLFIKVASWEELSSEEKIEIAKKSVSRDTKWNTFEKLLSWKEVSIEEKLEVAKELVAANVAEILQREMVVSSLSGEMSNITIWSKDCIDSDDKIRKFLTILWAKNIEVSSDFPWYGESYSWTTTIQFNY